MIAVIDVSGNNLTSLGNALKRLGCDFEMTHCIDKILQSSHVILPGVGTATHGMRALQEFKLVDVIKQLTKPILGICLGMQLLLEHSEEGDVECLGLIPGRAEKFPINLGFPVPHMGWNRLHWQGNSPIFNGISPGAYVYFVHSYALKAQEFSLARCTYKDEFTAMVQRDNVYGMQFHPEKSSETGCQLLKNFISLEAS